jgi:glycosyltransferase involved in cell wall biosynthesis
MTPAENQGLGLRHRDFYAGQGDWFPPRHEAMVEAMRAVAADPAEAARRGKLAAARAAEFSWDRTARELWSVLESFGAVPQRVAG